MSSELGELLLYLHLSAWGTGAALLGLGVIWFPIGGAFVSRWSRSRPSGQGITFKEGALASVWFLLPWVYLAMLLMGKVPSRRLVTAGYLTIFALWFVGPFGLWVSETISLLIWSDSTSGLSDLPTVAVLAPFSGGVAFLWGGTMYRAVKHLLEFDQKVRSGVAPEARATIAPEYLGVFKSAVLAFVLTPPALVAFFLFSIVTQKWG